MLRSHAVPHVLVKWRIYRSQNLPSASLVSTRHCASWASRKTDFHSIGCFAVIWTYFDFKIDDRVSELTAHLQTPYVFKSELISPRKSISNKSRHTGRYFRTKANTKPTKICTVDDADSRCGHSLRHGETTDTLPIA